MTKTEWIKRCAARYVDRCNVSNELSYELAKQCFDDQAGEFLESADYNPEGCADEDIEGWSDDSDSEEST